MSIVSKNYTISKFSAKLLSRLFFLLLLFSFAPRVMGEDTLHPFQTLYFYMTHKWAVIFPGILFLSFVVLFVLVAKNKYRMVDMNWMLSLNAALLIGYLLVLYIRLYPVIFS